MPLGVTIDRRLIGVASRRFPLPRMMRTPRSWTACIGYVHVHMSRLTDESVAGRTCPKDAFDSLVIPVVATRGLARDRDLVGTVPAEPSRAHGRCRSAGLRI